MMAILPVTTLGLQAMKILQTKILEFLTMTMMPFTILEVLAMTNTANHNCWTMIDNNAVSQNR